MKKVFFSLLVLMLAIACGQDKFVIKGTVAEGETLPDGTVVCLYDGETVLDSTVVANGAFELKAAANPEQPGKPQPPQLLPGRASKIACSFSSTSTCSFMSAMPRIIPIAIPTPATTHVAMIIPVIIVIISYFDV